MGEAFGKGSVFFAVHDFGLHGAYRNAAEAGKAFGVVYRPAVIRDSPRGTFTYAFAAFYAGIGSGGAEDSAFAAIFIGPVSRN